MIREAFQIAVPVIGGAELDIKSLTNEHERAMKDLNEKLGSGWRILQLIQLITTSQLIWYMFLLKLRPRIVFAKGRLR